MVDPAITGPAPGSKLRGAIEAFSWDIGDLPISSAILYVGSTVGGRDYAAVSVGTDRTVSIKDLPTDGSDVNVRLWYRLDGKWRNVDQAYTAADAAGLPQITSPKSGSTLAGVRQTFAWDGVGLPIDSTWLYVGSQPGQDDYSSSYSTDNTSVEVDGLPVDESAVHARLHYKVAGSWYSTDAEFVAAAKPEPAPKPEPVEEPIKLAAGGVQTPAAAAAVDRDSLVRELQTLVGTTADGDPGPKTRAALNKNWLGRPAGFDRSFAARFKNNPGVVKWVQGRLNAQDGLTVPVDGDFGEATETAVVEHLNRSGVVGVESFFRLFS